MPDRASRVASLQPCPLMRFGVGLVFGILGACDPTPGDAIRSIRISGTGTGSGVVDNITPPGLYDDQNVPISCTLTQGSSSGVCNRDVVEPDPDLQVTVTLGLLTSDSLTSVGGDCQGGPNGTCLLIFGATKAGTVQTLRAVFTIDSLGPQPVTFRDDFSAPRPWMTAVLGSTGGSTHVDSITTIGGVGTGGYRRMVHDLPPNSSIVVFHRFDGGNYDPSVQGAIVGVDYSEQRVVRNPPFAGAAVGTAVAVEQNGQVFTAAVGIFADTTWTGWSQSGLTAADFSPSPGPDFSVQGALLSFGYTRSNTNNSNNPGGRVHGIDDWEVVVRR